MSEGFSTCVYFSSITFHYELGRTFKHELLKLYCWFGIVGMTIALIATILALILKEHFDHYCDDHYGAIGVQRIKSRNGNARTCGDSHSLPEPKWL